MIINMDNLENIDTSLTFSQENKNTFVNTSREKEFMNIFEKIKSQGIVKELNKVLQLQGVDINELDSDFCGNLLQMMKEEFDDSTLDSSSISLNSVEDSPQPIDIMQSLKKSQHKGRKGGILTKFIDIPDLSCKKGKRDNEKSQPRKFPKLEYFRQKIIRKYKKEIKINYNKAVKNKNTDNPDYFIANEFYDHLISNKEVIKAKVSEFEEKSFSKEAYDCFFKSDEMIVNFMLFIEEYFNCKPLELIRKLGFKCCDRDEHFKCKDKWIELRNWVFCEFTGKNYGEIYINHF